MLFCWRLFLLTAVLDISSYQLQERDTSSKLSPNDETRLRLLQTTRSVAPDDPEVIKEEEGSLTQRALKRAITWTMKQRDSDYGWGTDTPHTVLALSLADETWFNPTNLESQLVIKQFEINLILKLWKHRDTPMSSGQIALNVMAIGSLCRNPRSFYERDLVALLEHHENRMDFEIAFADLASCNSGKRLKRSKIRRLLAMLSHTPKLHSVDTLSVVILALHCAQRQRRLELRNYLNEAIDLLLSHQAKNGAFASNLHSTAIALQALTSSGLSATWNVTQAQQYVMSHQLPDGSFGNIFDTNAVLPLLAGKTLLEVGRRTCPDDEVDIQIDQIDDTQEQEGDKVADISPSTSIVPIGPQPPFRPQIENISSSGIVEMINMTYILWIGNKALIAYNLTFSVPKNTNFYEIMQMAAERDQHYEFSASKWANGYYVHTLSGQHEKQNGFWFWLLYRLPELPVPGTKPDNKYVLGQGVVELIPEDGDILLFWYHKI